VVAFVITAVIMIFVVPAFKGVFASFGGELAGADPNRDRDFRLFVANWHIIFGGIYAAIYGLIQALQALRAVQIAVDKYFAQGSRLRRPDQEVLDCALDANLVHDVRRRRAAGRCAGFGRRRLGQLCLCPGDLQIQGEVSTGSSLTVAMENSGVFPPMVTQMVAIGEESGQLDSMLGKTADFFEAEVDEAVEALSSLMEPIIMVFLGGLIGGLVVAMYLPIFKLGSVVG
jgi:type IV pilus assembly protein PilC